MTYIWRLVDMFKETIREGRTTTFAQAKVSLAEAAGEAAAAENYNYRYDCLEEGIGRMDENNSLLSKQDITATIKKESE